MNGTRRLHFGLAMLALLVQPALAQPLSSAGVSVTGTRWGCDLDGVAIGTMLMHGSNYDIAGLDGAAIGAGTYRKGFEAITVLDGPLVELYGVRNGTYGTKAAEELIVFYGTDKKKLTCRGAAQ